MIKGLVVEACLRLRAAISAHSASKGSAAPVLLVVGGIAAEPKLRARACSGGARRGLVEKTGGAADVACVVTLPSHWSGFGKFVVLGIAGAYNIRKISVFLSR